MVSKTEFVTFHMAHATRGLTRVQNPLAHALSDLYQKLPAIFAARYCTVFGVYSERNPQ